MLGIFMKRRLFLLIFLLLIPFHSFGRGNDDVGQIPDQEQIDHLIERIPAIIQEVDDHEIRREHERIENLHEQNRILWSVETPLTLRLPEIHGPNPLNFRFQNRQINLGIRSRDLLEGVVFGANISADIIMYKYLKKWRVDRIKSYLIEHYQEVENLLLHIQQEVKKIEQQLNNKKITQLDATKQKNELGPLLKKFAHHEHSIKTVFKDPKLLAIVLGRLTIEKVGKFIKEKKIKPWHEKDFIFSWQRPSYLQPNYIYDAQGQLIIEEGATISIVNIIRLLFNPNEMINTTLGSADGTGKSILEFYNGLFDLGLPNFLFNSNFKKVAYFVTQTASLCWAAKLYDDMTQNRWIKHLQENHQELLKIIQEYKKVQKQKESLEKSLKIKEIELRIEAFIMAGNYTSSYFSVFNDLKNWQSLKQVFLIRINNYKNYLFYGLVALKIYQFYRQLISPPIIQNN